MKKLLLLIITAALMFSLISCGEDDEKFDPVPSTEEESRVVMTFKVGDETYPVRYELYRALFIGNHELVDGGDLSRWSTSEREQMLADMDVIITDRAAEIYSVLHLAKQLDIDPYSSAGDKALHNRIKLYVHGGTTESGTKVIGYGSYAKYLDSLAKKGMNYSVGELMFRYSYALDKINEKLVKAALEGATDSALRSYYESEDCARILEAYFQLGTKTEERVNEIRDDLAYADTLAEAAALIIYYTAAIPSEVITPEGEIVGKPVGFYELDDYYYLEYTIAAFGLGAGETSGVITIDNVHDSYTDGYYILIGLEKTEDYFKDNKSAIRQSYVNNTVGRKLYSAKATLLDGFAYSANYDSIDHIKILEEHDILINSD
ncbi:MAG: peptidyl-prolyl cis-trans isomerase [Clostridia bacterium]|nr:peptidyl-prolyl cis-trans isomerase [Clostridia bacterium]